MIHPPTSTLSPDSKHAYVSNLDGTVAVIDTTTKAITGRITTPAPAASVALTPDGTTLLVSGTNDTVTAINVNTTTVVATGTTDPTADTTSTPSLEVAADGTIYQTDNTDNALRILHIGTVVPNHPPTVGVPVVGAPDPTTGAVDVTVVGTDPDDGDPLNLYGEHTHRRHGEPRSGARVVHLHPLGTGPPARRHHPGRGHRPLHHRRQRPSDQRRRPGNRAGDTRRAGG